MKHTTTKDNKQHKHVLNHILGISLMSNSRDHGPSHWWRVRRNGLLMARQTGADRGVVTYFAIFHDAMRENEWRDPEHGPRGAKLAKKLRHMLPLNDHQMRLLTRACAGHTHGRHTKCSTLGTCWDADRLDLPRVGIIPAPHRMLTDHGKRLAALMQEQMVGGSTSTSIPTTPGPGSRY